MERERERERERDLEFNNDNINIVVCCVAFGASRVGLVPTFYFL